jgi:hypothetical protein
VYPAEAHEAIGRYYEEYFTGKWQACDEYGLRYAATHLIATCRGATWRQTRRARVDRLCALLSDNSFVESVIQQLGKTALLVQLRAALDIFQIESQMRIDFHTQMEPVVRLYSRLVQEIQFPLDPVGGAE